VSRVRMYNAFDTFARLLCLGDMEPEPGRSCPGVAWRNTFVKLSKPRVRRG
jgi:hypothetical protein